MIARFYAGVVDRMAVASGWQAFVKWFFLGVLAQIVGLAIGFPIILLASRGLDSHLRDGAQATSFLALFIVIRCFTCAMPSVDAAARKNAAAPSWTWWIGGILFGQFAPAFAAALSPRNPAP